MKTQENLKNVYAHLDSIGIVQELSGLLHWDERVCMPVAAEGTRMEQKSYLASLEHSLFLDEKFVSEVKELSTVDTLSQDDSVNIRKTLRNINQRSKVPATLVKALSEAESVAHSAWLQARKENSFQIVRDSLGELVRLQRDYATVLADGGDKYEALLDLYEPEMKTYEVDSYFKVIKPELISLMNQIVERKRDYQPKTSDVYPLDSQKEFCKRVVQTVGFDFKSGRLDESVHPFQQTIGANDARLTTNFSDSNPFRALYASLHEAGHALYELGLRQDQKRRPMGASCSLGVHESQSLFWEQQIGRSRSFWKHIFKMFKQFFPHTSFENLEQCYKASSVVKPSLKRVGADEVTYGLHVIIRFELEQKIISSELEVNDLPEAWNDSYEQALGIRPKTDLEGVLQDIHWYSGAFGYFPTYLLGAMFAAQLQDAMKEEIQAFETQLAEGNFKDILHWLTKNVHSHGQRYRGVELIEVATKKKTTADSYLTYLNNKFGELYQLS